MNRGYFFFHTRDSVGHEEGLDRWAMWSHELLVLEPRGAPIWRHNSRTARPWKATIFTLKNLYYSTLSIILFYLVSLILCLMIFWCFLYCALFTFLNFLENIIIIHKIEKINYFWASWLFSHTPMWHVRWFYFILLFCIVSILPKVYKTFRRCSEEKIQNFDSSVKNNRYAFLRIQFWFSS